MSKQITSAVCGLAVSIITALVAFGVLGGEKANIIQGVVLSAISLIGVVAIRSARP